MANVFITTMVFMVGLLLIIVNILFMAPRMVYFSMIYSLRQ